MKRPRSVSGPARIFLLVLLGLLIATGLACWRLNRASRQLSLELTAARSEILRLNELKRRGEPSEVTSPPDAGRPTDLSRTSVSPAPSQVETEPNGVVARMIELQLYLSAHPERGIPEFRLLHEEDWMEEALKADLETEAGCRLALNQLRQLAQNRSFQIVAAALRAFRVSHPERSPATSAELRPFLQQAEDADLLASFVSYTGDARMALAGGETWIFQQKPGVDDWFDTETFVGSTGSFGIQSMGPGFAVAEAAERFTKDHGIQPTDLAQIMPYLKEPVSASTVEAVLHALQRPRR